MRIKCWASCSVHAFLVTSDECLPEDWSCRICLWFMSEVCRHWVMPQPYTADPATRSLLMMKHRSAPLETKQIKSVASFNYQTTPLLVHFSVFVSFLRFLFSRSLLSLHLTFSFALYFYHLDSVFCYPVVSLSKYFCELLPCSPCTERVKVTKLCIH